MKRHHLTRAELEREYAERLAANKRAREKAAAERRMFLLAVDLIGGLQEYENRNH